MTVKDNSSRNILITALVLIILQGANLVGVALNRSDITDNKEKVVTMWNDYVPMWFLEGLTQNTNYQTQEIIATMQGDQAKVKEINTKYIEFQKTMINNMIKMRGGTSLQSRGLSNLEK